MKNTMEKISAYVTQGTALDLDQFTLNELIKKAITSAAYLQARYGMPIEIADEIARNAQEHVSAVWIEFFTSETECTLQDTANNVIKNYRFSRKNSETRYTSYDKPQETEETEFSLECFADVSALDPFTVAELKTDVAKAIRDYSYSNGNAKQTNIVAAQEYARLILDGLTPTAAMERSGIGYKSHRTINKIIAKVLNE